MFLRHCLLLQWLQPPFFHKFWSAVGFKVEVPNPTFPSETICFCGRQRKPAFVTRRRFCIAFGTPPAPFWHHFWRQNLENEPPKRVRKPQCFLVRLFIDFRSILAPKTMRPFVEKASFSTPKIRLRAPGGSFWPFWALWYRFRAPFWSFWVPFW